MPIDVAKHEIRLIEILPCDRNPKCTAPITQSVTQTDGLLASRVRGRMKRVCLDDSPVYTALSYTWGDANDRKLILLDDVEVSIGANLENALSHIRDESATIPLWADALCINQSDDEEKSEAVQQMKRIYHEATQVIVWLGPSYEDSDVAFDVMDRIGKEACEIGFWDIPLNIWLESLSHDSGPYAKMQNLMREKITLDYPFETVAKLTYRPWWYRVWVLQEFVLARHVSLTCGFKSITYAHFFAALITSTAALMRLIERAATTPEDWTDPIKAARMEKIFTNVANPRASNMMRARQRYHSNPESHETLIQLLRRANSVTSALNDLHATDHRDRIYGMLGLACDTDKLGIRPDYLKSCEETYIDTARALLQHGHTDILVFSQFPKHYSTLPCWVPDWTTTIQEPCGGCIADASFNASAQLPLCSPAVSDSSDTSRLIALNGSRVDKITEVGTPWLPTIVGYVHDWTQSVTFISEIESFCDRSNHLARPIYKSHEQREEAVWRIPCGDMDQLGNTGRHRARSTGPDVLEGFKLLKKGFESCEASRSNDLRLRSYQMSMGGMFKRRPFLSEQGYVGLVPSHTEVGDVIVIIYGAIVPFILRDLGNGRCQFIGEAYVHGIMDGEYLEKHPQTETFILC